MSSEEGVGSASITEVVLELDPERAIVEQFGGAVAVDLVHLVEAVVDVEARLHGPEGDLAVAISLHDQACRSAEVEIIAVPQVRLDDAPPTDDRVVRRLHGVAPARSLGSRTRL